MRGLKQSRAFSAIGVLNVDELLCSGSSSRVREGLAKVERHLAASTGSGNLDISRFEGPSRATLFQSHVTVFATSHTEDDAAPGQLAQMNRLALERMLRSSASGEEGSTDAWTLDADFFAEVAANVDENLENTSKTEGAEASCRRDVAVHAVNSFLFRKSNRNQPFLDEALKAAALVEDFGLASPKEVAPAIRIVSGLCWRGRFDEAFELLGSSGRGSIRLPEESELSCVKTVLTHYDRLQDIDILEGIAEEVVLPIVRRPVARKTKHRRLHVHHNRFVEEMEKRAAGLQTPLPKLAAVVSVLRDLSPAEPPSPPSDADLERLIAEQLDVMPVACVGAVSPPTEKDSSSALSFLRSWFSWLTGGAVDRDREKNDIFVALSNPDAVVDWSMLGNQTSEGEKARPARGRKGGDDTGVTKSKLGGKRGRNGETRKNLNRRRKGQRYQKQIH